MYKRTVLVLMVLPAVSQAKDRGFEPKLASSRFDICRELVGEGNHRKEPCTQLQRNLMICVKFPI